MERPPLAVCLKGIVQAFDQHAAIYGDSQTMCRREVRNMVIGELKDLIMSVKDQKKLQELFDELHSEEQMDFAEYMSAMTTVITICFGKDAK